jgi:type IV secretory pathway TraG/TraD family ATPase VirD4
MMRSNLTNTYLLSCMLNQSIKRERYEGATTQSTSSRSLVDPKEVRIMTSKDVIDIVLQTSPAHLISLRYASKDGDAVTDMVE